MAQVFARTDEPYADTLGIPNEDAQSFVFDATTLFERDKFSGYDRIEGGTRANLGLRYSGAFGNGWTANGIVRPVLPSRRRELVRLARPRQCRRLFGPGDGHVGLRRPGRLRHARSACRPRPAHASTSRRSKCAAASSRPAIDADAFIGDGAATPSSRRSRSTASTRTARSCRSAGSARFHENWRVFGSGTYDFETDVLVQ